MFDRKTVAQYPMETKSLMGVLPKKQTKKSSQSRGMKKTVF